MLCPVNRKLCVFLKDGKCSSKTVCSPCVIGCQTASLGKRCPKIVTNQEVDYCLSYKDPKVKWSLGKKCPLRQEIEIKEERKKINPLKASKQKAKKS